MTTAVLTTREAAARLGITRDALLKRIQRGTVTPTQKLPGPRGDYLFAPDLVEELAAVPDSDSVLSS